MNAVAKRKAEDAERSRLAKLDKANFEATGQRTWFLLAWTLKQQGLEEMAPRGRKPGAKTQAENLLKALDFVSVAATKSDQFYQQHVRLAGNRVVAFDGQIAAGHPIIEDLALNPHLGQMRTAINRCGASLNITELETGRLSIKGEKLRALVPCLPASDMPDVTPDNPCASIDDRIKEAFKVCGSLASENDTRVFGASLLLEAGQCTGTNGAALLQFWHGIDLPPAMVVPKIFAAAVVKSPYKLEGFGVSFDFATSAAKSITFYFEGGAWIKTALYADKWPDVAPLVNQASYPKPTPPELFEAIGIVAEFNNQGIVELVDGGVQSHESTQVGAQYEVAGLQGGKRFDGKLVKQVATYATTIDLTTYGDRAFFFGGTQSNPVRGVIMSINKNYQPETQPADEEVPF